MSPFRFIVMDESAGRPVPNAAVQLIDPRFFLCANVDGRRGLLGQTETISYKPWLIRVEAGGYRPFFTLLVGDPPMADGFPTGPDVPPTAVGEDPPQLYQAVRAGGVLEGWTSRLRWRPGR